MYPKPETRLSRVYLTLGAFAFCGLVAAALFQRETLGKALAVSTKDIDLEEDEPLIQSLGAQVRFCVYCLLELRGSV
jgi:hypothetical protein